MARLYTSDCTSVSGVHASHFNTLADGESHVYGNETGVVIISTAGSTEWGSVEPASGPNYIAIEGSGCYAESTITHLTPGVEYEVRFMTACRPDGEGDETLSVEIDGGASTECCSASPLALYSCCVASRCGLLRMQVGGVPLTAHLDGAACVAHEQSRSGSRRTLLTFLRRSRSSSRHDAAVLCFDSKTTPPWGQEPS